MIVGISGKMGSGKDTVAKLLQAVSTPEDTFWHGNAILYATEPGPNLKCDWKIKKFGDKLKEIASLLTGIPREKFEDQEFKMSNLGPEWNTEKVWPDSSMGKGRGGQTMTTEIIPMTVREFLQKLGNDSIKLNLHWDTWKNALFIDYKAELQTNGKVGYPNWIISDMRYIDECEAVKIRGGYTVRVNRPNNPHPVSTHMSETGLDNYEGFDFVVNNEGTVEDLVIKVKMLLTLLKNKDVYSR